MDKTPTVLDEMNDRSREVFRRVVEGYLANGDPVGSRTLTRDFSEKVSAATIRNVMQDLEYMGLLEIWIENRPKCSAWWHRIKARLAYQRGVSDRLTTSDIEPMQRFGGAIHLRVAELRQDYLREFVITD